ncbi:redoxin domain-containing protein [Mucilaginibacter sp. CSA2-8R]|uniref:peroxiredoxin family protein n=1 Tax=Mucilaginibacter sp. CSA2-8R TaxID=3141542 RepID=UPI00315DC8E6
MANQVDLELFKYINIVEGVNFSKELSDGKFKFNFKLTEPAYFNLQAEKAGLTFFLIEPGDSLHLSIDAKLPTQFTFLGKGSASATYQYTAAQKYNRWFNPPVKIAVENYPLYFAYIDSNIAVQLDYLNAYKNLLSPVAYQTLHADIIYDGEIHKSWFWGSVKSQDGIELYYKKLFARKRLIINDSMVYSRNLPYYLLTQNEIDYQRLYNIDGGKFSFNGKYMLLKALTNGRVQERALAQLMLQQISIFGDQMALSEKDYLNGPYNAAFKERVRARYELQQKFGVGKPAIDFTLPDINNKKISLSNFKGKLVLLDFWYNGCPSCAKVFNAMNTVKDHFKSNANVVFLNISVDQTKTRWQQGIDLYKINDGVNVYTEGKGENHEVIKNYGINGYPSQFLIDKQSRYVSYAPPRPELDNGKALIALMENVLAAKK